MGKNGLGFTEDKLKELGYHCNDEGQWVKGSVQPRNPKPSPPKLEPDSSLPTPNKIELQEKRKGRFQKGSRIRYCVIVHSFRRKLIDPSNPYLKPIEDCLTKCGIIPDDSAKFCDQPLFLQTQSSVEKTTVSVLAYEC